MWLQNFTVNEPDDSMLEVAIEALKLVLPEEQGKDASKIPAFWELKIDIQRPDLDIRRSCGRRASGRHPGGPGAGVLRRRKG